MCVRVQGIITDLRAADLISNEEYGHLGFKAVHFLKEAPYFLKPLVSPVCFFAGKVRRPAWESTCREP